MKLRMKMEERKMNEQVNEERKEGRNDVVAY